MPSYPSNEERRKVGIYREKWKAAERVFKRNAPRSKELREMLAGKFSSIEGGSYDHSNPTDRAIAGMYEQTNTNLGLRMTTSLKATACADRWEVVMDDPGDFPEKDLPDVEMTLAKVMEDGGVTDEYRDCIDDVATIGCAVIKYGVGLKTLDREYMAGLTQEISDFVLSVANAQPGEEVIHPSRGMDFQQTAKALRDFQAQPDNVAMRSIEQQQNLIRVAQECDQMWLDEMDAKPSGYVHDGMWFQRCVLGEDVLWDATVTTRWSDAGIVFFKCSMPLRLAKKEPTWKASARKELKGETPNKSDGYEPVVNVDGMTDAEGLEMNGVVVYIEAWDKDANEVHQFTETGGGWDGFLERDPTYPHAGDDGKSVLKHWFPMRACVPVTHNLRVPERTHGMPVLAAGLDAWIQYILFDTALTSCRKKAGDIIEVPSEITEDEFSDIEGAKPRSIIKRPPGLKDGSPLVHVHSIGESPMDFQLGKSQSLEAFAAAVDMDVPSLSGVSIAPTLGQEEMAAGGAQARRRGLINKLQAFGGEIASDVAALVRLRYSAERIAKIAGLDFTKRLPIPGPDGQPQVGEDGKALETPSTWDLWRASSLCGDRFKVTFAPIGREADLMRAQAADNFIAMLSTQINPFTQAPYFDPRKLLMKEADVRGYGKLDPLVPTEDDLAQMANMAEAQAGAVGDETGEGSTGGGDSREAPGGGRTDSRLKNGERGPQPIPGRKSAMNGKRDVGDASTKVHRPGL